MTYQVKEVFYSLQGEGARAGRPAVFCRFAGCNLWSGREEDRETATCSFCDTDFVGTDGEGGGKFESAKELAAHLRSFWPNPQNGAVPYLVFTGGEPALQLDSSLIAEAKALGFEVAVETNGTIQLPDGLDWITVSPKADTELKQTSGNELKLVYPQEKAPTEFEKLEFEHFYLSPMTRNDPKSTDENTRAALTYCLNNPKWQLTMQHHKLWHIR